MNIISEGMRRVAPPPHANLVRSSSFLQMNLCGQYWLDPRLVSELLMV